MAIIYMCHSRRSSKYRVVTIRHVKSRYSANVAPFSGTLRAPHVKSRYCANVAPFSGTLHDAGMPFPHAFHSHYFFDPHNKIHRMENNRNNGKGHLQTIFLKISVIMTIVLDPLPPPLSVMAKVADSPTQT